MFVPKKFAVGDLRALDALVERDAFATLVSQHEGAPFATHLPVMYSREHDRVGFSGHWAKANPQWQTIASQTALLIVHGPHAYVSPTWYDNPAESVPTWNYTVAHAYGRITTIHDPDALSTLVAGLSAHYESKLGSDWRFPSSAPGTTGELSGIVGFDFTVDRIEIKHKLNQHHAAADVRGAVEGLRTRSEPGSHEIADLMHVSLVAREGSNDA